jgi:hypothetical protein
MADRVQHGTSASGAWTADAGGLGSGVGPGIEGSGLTFQLDQTGGQVIPSRTLSICGPVFGGQVNTVTVRPRLIIAVLGVLGDSDESRSLCSKAGPAPLT